MPVYQEPSLIPDLDVLQNLRLTQTPVEPFRQWVKELGVPDLDLGDTARDIPLAIQRVLDLARALAMEPDILILDEMTAALPANLAERVMEVVRNQGKTGRSVIFISHRFVEISAICDRATVLRDGDTVGVVDIAPGAEEKIVELMLGAKIEKKRATVAGTARSRREQAARLACSNLRRRHQAATTSRSTSTTARSRASSRSRARGRTSCSRRSRDRSSRPAGTIEVDGAAGELQSSARRHRPRARLCARATAARRC